MTGETISEALEGIKANLDQQGEAISGIKADLGQLQRKPKCKDASKLSQVDLVAMKAMRVNFNEWKEGGCLRTHRDVRPADIIPLLQTCVERVRLTSKSGDEKRNVKPAVVSLLESILRLPRYQSKFKVKPEVNFTLSYQGTGDDDVETIVTGFTDHVLMPRDKELAVATVESKQSTENIAQPKDEAQFLAELSAEFNRIVDVSLFKPHEMCGAITNGVSWAFARRFVWRGEYYLHYAHVVHPANNDIQQEVDDFFESVASFLIYMMEVSVDIADGVSMQYNPAAAAVLSGGEVDGVPGGESDDERDNESNQDVGPDGGKFISGQAPKPMKRPYGFCDDDSHFIASLTVHLRI